MKLIKAFVKETKEGALIEALQNTDEIFGLTISNVRGFGDINHWKDADILSPRHYLQFELAVKPELVESIINVFSKICHSGNKGDGRIFVSDIETSYRISTKNYL